MTFLHKEELREISKAKQKKTLLRWLDGLGIRYIPDAEGWPIAAESAIREKLGESVKREPRLNLS